MPEIIFTSVDPHNLEDLRAVFEYIAVSKREGHVNETSLAVLLEHYIDERFDSKGRNGMWDYGSWVDALNNSEILYKSIIVDDFGNGALEYFQQSWPSGGLEASEEIVRIFGGVVISNSGE